MCLELALEGERLCKSGDCRAGVAFFQVSEKAKGLKEEATDLVLFSRRRFKLELMTYGHCLLFTASLEMLIFILVITQKQCSIISLT